MTRVRVGALRHRIALQSAIVAPGPGGGAGVSWQTDAELWASVVAVRGVEDVHAAGVRGTALYDITIRFRDDVGSESRFVLADEIFDIRSALDLDGHKRWLVCRCEKRRL